MKFAVMSDSHDNIWNLRKALEGISVAHCDLIIHCGDFVAPFMFDELARASIPVHCVFGNNDGDRFLLTKKAAESNGIITLYGAIGELEISGVSVTFVHEKEIALGLAALGKYDMVCFGHTHKHFRDKVGSTVLLNPGEVMGKDGSPGFCIVNLEKHIIQRVPIK